MRLLRFFELQRLICHTWPHEELLFPGKILISKVISTHTFQTLSPNPIRSGGTCCNILTFYIFNFFSKSGIQFPLSKFFFFFNHTLQTFSPNQQPFKYNLSPKISTHVAWSPPPRSPWDTQELAKCPLDLASYGAKGKGTASLWASDKSPLERSFSLGAHEI